MNTKSLILTVSAAIILALGLQNFLIAPSSQSSGFQTTSYNRVMASNTLRCAYAIYPPFLSKDPNTGKLSGIGPDVMAEFEKATGIKVTWGPEIDFGAITPTLQSGKADAFCTEMAMTPARGRVLAGSIPLSFGAIEGYVRKDDKRFDNNPEAINHAHVKVEVNMGDLSEQIAQRFFPQATKVYKGEMGGEDQLFLDVAMGKADITFSGPSNLSAFNKGNPEKALRKVPFARPLYSVPGVIAVDIHEQALLSTLNAAMHDLVDNGVISRILSKNTGPDYGTAYLPPKPRF